MGGRVRQLTAIATPLAALILGVMMAGPAGAGGPGQALYDKLRAASVENPHAARAVAEIDAFVRRTGKGVQTAQELGREDKLGGRTITVHGLAPIFLSVGVGDIISSKADLAAYRAARHAELRTLAAESPRTDITVQMTSTGHRTVEAAWRDLQGVGAKPITLMVDVFQVDRSGGRQWLSRFTHTATDDEPDQFLGRSGPEVVADIRVLLAEAHAGEADYDAAALDFEVFTVRARTTADAALALSKTPGVLLVDSETAIAAQYADQAAHIQVAAMPTVPDGLRWAGEMP